MWPGDLECPPGLFCRWCRSYVMRREEDNDSCTRHPTPRSVRRPLCMRVYVCVKLVQRIHGQDARGNFGDTTTSCIPHTLTWSLGPRPTHAYTHKHVCDVSVIAMF